MSWTYDGSSSPGNRDKVRLLCGDTSSGSTGGLVSDEEIAWYLTEASNNVYRAAALACDQIAGVRADEGNIRIGNLTISGADVYKQWSAKAVSLRQRATMRGVSPFVGGISQGAKDTQKSDADRVVPAFRIDLHDNPSTGST